MVEGALVVALASLVVNLVLIWRILIVESSLHERVDDIDTSLAKVVGMLIERIENLASKVPEINMVNPNPLGMILEFMKSNRPPDPKMPFINCQSTPRGHDGQFIEVEELVKNASKKEKENTKT